MEAYVKPLDRLRESLRWFIAVPELLLMHVHTGPELRQTALQRIVEAQAQPENRAAIFVFTTPAEADEGEWLERGDELRATFEAFREAAAQGKPAYALREPSTPFAPGVAGFAAALRATSDAVVPACQGVIAVLAPEGITDAARWLAQIRQLVGDRSLLSKVRFILVEPDPAPSSALAVELAGLGERVDIRVDGTDTRRFLAKLVNGMKTAPVGAEPIRIAGMAGPKEAPPPRAGKVAPPPELAAQELQAAGLNGSLAQAEVVKALRIETMSANLALQEGRTGDAVQHQTQARDVAERAGLKREATLFNLMLGGYLLQGGATPQAQVVFDDTAKRANADGFADLEAQSHMARGGVFMMNQRPFDAARAYQQGGAVAETLPSKLLAIECYRTVGSILMGAGAENEAAVAWQKAIALAEAGDPLERVASSAPLAAKDLAALYRKNGLNGQASALEAQVKRWEAEVPKPPAEDGAGASA
jgi:hypothetical protein